MKRTLDIVTTGMACVGIFLILGACGSSDFAYEMGLEYSVFTLFKSLGLGLLLIMPSIVKGALNGKK